MTENEKAASNAAENTASQTLFRFVSLRSPQLSDDKDQDKRFILMSQEVKDNSHFYTPVTQGSGSKKRLLQTQAASYATSLSCITKGKPNNLDVFKRTYKVIYDFGVWLARNKDTCTYQEFASRRDAVLASNYALPNMTSLWDNLIFQTVTQKDFYIKETMMQVILATHVIQNYSQNEDRARTLLAARIVLPKELMMDEDSLSTSSTVSRLASSESKESFPTQEMQRQQKIASAKGQIIKAEALVKNLTIFEKQYNKAYQAAYDSAKAEYERTIAPTLARHREALAAEKENFCSTRPQEQAYDPKDPCRQPREIPYPDIPKFEFSYKDQVSGDSMVSALKAENLDTLLSLIGYEFKATASRGAAEDIRTVNALLEGRNTLADIHDLISESTERNNNIIVENTSGDEDVFVSIGGVIMPMSRAVSEAFTYQLCPRTPYRLPVFDLALNVPDSTWDVSYADYMITANSGNGSLGMNYYTKSRSGNTIFLKDLFKDGIDHSLAENSTINFKISFTNGKVINFTARNVNYKTCTSGAFEVQTEEGGAPPTAVDDENTFIPSGFGFKQIGIADYLKVEQTTHAYVEGEVAHIENVMAREYREKSTRRLRRSENTNTSSSDTEREQLSDTTTANRFEMQSEIAKMQQESSDFGLSANFSASWNLTGGGKISTGLGTSYANHKSKEESTRQAVTQSQDITARAMDRIVSKVHEERIEKIIEEFEETNSHGLDNRKGDQHVVGVYRWVDKVMKNQIYNYGKRMMFEFMVPEPAKLHLLGMKVSPNSSELIKPVDPRTSSMMQMKDYSYLSDESILKYWSAKYNVALDEILADRKNVSYSFSDKTMGVDFVDRGQNNGFGRLAGFYSKDLEIPENYVAIKLTGDITIRGGGWESASRMYPGAILSIADKRVKNAEEGPFDAATNGSSPINMDLDHLEGKVGLSLNTWDVKTVGGSVTISCLLKPSYKTKWNQEIFNKIIKAYEEALVEYNNAVTEENNKAVIIRDSNPNFYRQIENTVLRKNCISYMADRAVGSTHGYGLEGLTSGSTFGDYETVLSSQLDQYTAFVKFMEQAFEWENISYFLYPYYWGKKTNWTDLYQSENTDPIFRNFLQSGMARVVATVRPGFEDAVQFYLATGKIWNGGEVPVIGDELYLSIVDEMREPKGIKQGKAWLTRLPTTLNILQAESIGLKVAHALPFTTENPDDFEVPSEVITADRFNFEKNNHLLGNQSDEDQKIITGDWI